MNYPKNIVAVTLGGERWEKCQDAYPGVVPFYGVDGVTVRKRWMHPDDYVETRRVGIPATYHILIPWLISEGADLDTLIIQDDVRFSEMMPDYKQSTIFGRQRAAHHVCPQAFSFTSEVFYELEPVWDGVSQVCVAWWPVVKNLPVLTIASD